MRNSFSAQLWGMYAITLFLLLFQTIDITAQCASGTIAGTVYMDANNNGISESSEAGNIGTLVRVYDANGSWVGQAVTDSNGDFLISNLDDGGHYRLQYNVGGSYQVANLGTGNGGDIQFVTAPYCNADLGLISDAGTCGPSSEIFIACFVNGLGANSPDQETIIGLSNSFNATSPINVYATQRETGSIWGVVYNENTGELFSSAFVKQHASLGSGGIGAIYRTDINGPSTTVLTDLSSLGINVGNLSATNSANCIYGSQVGKMGRGGMTSDPSGSILYVANLFDNSIVELSSVNPRRATTSSYQVPNPGCTNGDYRIFGICLLYTSPSPRDQRGSRMPSSA